MSFGLLSVGFEMFESRMVWCGVVLVLFYVNHKLGDLPFLGAGCDHFDRVL